MSHVQNSQDSVFSTREGKNSVIHCCVVLFSVEPVVVLVDVVDVADVVDSVDDVVEVLVVLLAVKGTCLQCFSLQGCRRTLCANPP